MVQRELHFAIVDEVDNILIDEARTPLIISGPAEESTDYYAMFARLVPRLQRDRDFEIEERTQSITLTEDGIERVEKMLGINNLYDPRNYQLTHYLDNAMKAQFPTTSTSSTSSRTARSSSSTNSPAARCPAGATAKGCTRRSRPRRASTSSART